jgi:DNA-binding MarR family transcriptional regulator
MLDMKVKNIGIRRTEHRTLMMLAKRDMIPSQKMIAEKLDVTPAAVTGILKRLENDGYISRTLGNDNRFNEIKITEKGRATVKFSREMFESADKSLFDGFSEEELDMYITCLEKIKKNLKDHIDNDRSKESDK